ncbi:MAG: zinc ABC transporter substrate-binding protein [Planctomycetes bacterium]|nr:zinc ABC transporter substrate-binding protein [Planctomycetota bacterium]
MPTTHRIGWFVACLLATGLTLGCNPASPGPNPSQKNRTIKIVTTTGMVTDIVRQVVGSHAEVTGLIEAGGDPHIFKPKVSHVKQLSEADVVFYSGLMLEGRMGETFTQLQRSGKPVFAVTESLDKEYLQSPPDFAGHYDPHVWMDVKAWSKCVEHVAESMSKVDEAHAAEYRVNADAYQKELAILHEYVKTSIRSIPESQRVLVTAHDAFEYFSRAYDIEVKSVQGVTTESEAGVQDVNRLVDFLVERKLPAIFVESSVNQKNIEAVIEGAKSRGVTVNIGGQLFSDAMGVEGSYEGTYIGMIDHNATLITKALGGEVKDKGMNGKLGLEERK